MLSAHKKYQMLRLCADRLADVGLSIDQCSDPLKSFERMQALRKTEGFPPLSPRHNDFHGANAFWVFFVDNDGTDVGGVAARIDDLGQSSVDDHWEGMRWRYGLPTSPGSRRLPFRVSGMVAYLGDMYLRRQYRDPEGHVRACIFTLYMLASIEWPKLDWMYAVVNEAFLGAGSGTKYCASHQALAPDIWKAAPDEPASWLIALDQPGLVNVCETFLQRPHLFDNSRN